MNCPYCSHNKTTIAEHRAFTMDNPRYRWACPRCHARGPLKGTQGEAQLSLEQTMLVVFHRSHILDEFDVATMAHPMGET